jgi:hypothetical protein
VHLRQVAERRDGRWSKSTVSGAKGRKQRPGLDRMLNDASRGKFDVVMAYAMPHRTKPVSSSVCAGTKSRLRASGRSRRDADGSVNVSTELIKDEIEKFLSTDEPGVLCIRGKWGVGKTYTWDRALEEAQFAKRIGLHRYSYVSLFGIRADSGHVR